MVDVMVWLKKDLCTGVKICLQQDREKQAGDEC